MLSLKNTLKENPKLLVIFGLLALLFTVTSLLQPSFRDPATLTNTMRSFGANMYRLVVRETATHKVAVGDDTGQINAEESVIACAQSGYMERAFQ